MAGVPAMAEALQGIRRVLLARAIWSRTPAWGRWRPGPPAPRV